MHKKIILAIALYALSPAVSNAGEWNYDFFGKSHTLYGYSDYDSNNRASESHNHFPTRLSAGAMAQYAFNDDYQLGLYLDLAYGIDQQLKDYNHGSWGEQIYGVLDSPYGKFILGQSYNAAYQLSVGAPTIDVLGINQSDIVNFIANPNWQRNRKGTAYRTLNSTDINTDGTAPKITYISPEFNNGTMYGLSYVPESYSRDGLINSQASYKDSAGYIAALSHTADVFGFSLSGSLGAAYYEDNDYETSLGLSAYRKGWTLGGSLRRTWKDGKINRPIRKFVPDYDAYRDSWAADAGIGYEFGPFKTALTYFYAKADCKDYSSEIYQWENSYQYNKHLVFNAAVARGKFDSDIDNAGYAYIIGADIKF